MASIVQRLNNRYISGRGLGIDLHKYDGQLLLLLWKEKDREQCYTHVLERKFLEIPEYTLLQNDVSLGFSRHARVSQSVVTRQMELPLMSISSFRIVKTHFI